MKLLSCFILLLSLTFLNIHKSNAQSTKGTEFWAAFMENLDISQNGQPKFSFLIQSDYNTTGTIILAAASFTPVGPSVNFTVVAGQVTEVFLPYGIFYASGSEAVSHYGIKITASNPVRVTAHHHRIYFSEATNVLPVSELGSEYLVMTHSDDYRDQLTSGDYSEFVVVATEDNTTLEITPSVLTLNFHPAGVPYFVTLNKGETYQLQSYYELTGTKVKETSGKKIALYSGATRAFIFNCIPPYSHPTDDNHLYDVNFPVSSWGTEYMAIPHIDMSTGMIFRILASEDQTIVQVDCINTATLNSGRYIDLNLFSATHITSTKPIAMAQFHGMSDCNHEPTVANQGGPTFVIQKPLSLSSNKIIFNSLTNAFDNLVNPNRPEYGTHYVNIVSKTSNKNLVKIDGNPVGASFSLVPQSPNYSFAKITLTVGMHVLESDSGFNAFAYGFGAYDGYSYDLGYDEKKPTVVSISSNSLSCKDSIVNFSGNATNIPASWNWQFGDGNTSNQQNPSHSYHNAGTYYATLTAPDAAGCLYSNFIVLNIKDCALTGTLTVDTTTVPDECEIFVPSAFSPNKNGANDFECVYGICIKEIDFTIYDRWGEMVFNSKDQKTCWDGTYKGKLLDNAIFAYRLKAVMLSGKEVIKKGNITLIK